MNFIQRLFQRLFGSKKPKLNIPLFDSYFIIRYTVDGNLNNVLKYECLAKNEAMAKYDFWDTHNVLYHDILSVTKTDYF